MDVESADYVFVMERCTLHYGSGKQYGFKISDGRYDSGTADLERNKPQARQRTFGLKFIGNGPSGAFGREAEIELLAYR